MKILLFSALLLASYCSALDLICTAPFGRIGFLPHLDCTKFYVCNWLAILERRCPIGLHWNPRANICDNPSAAGCIVGSTVTPSTTPTGSSTQASTTALEEEEAEETNDETPKVTCPPGDGPDFLFNRNDCTKFYRCERGIPTEMDCPQGFFFNRRESRCDDSEISDCELFISTTPGNVPT